MPWQPLGQPFDAFADIRGIGLSKMTKALHPKRPALVPMLDSVVQTYLAHDDLGAGAPFGERALALVRGYKRDLELNRRALRATRRELVRRGHDLTEVRILDLLICVGTSRRLNGASRWSIDTRSLRSHAQRRRCGLGDSPSLTRAGRQPLRWSSNGGIEKLWRSSQRQPRERGFS